MHSHSHKPPVLVIVGPTCSGKSEVSLRLAEGLNGEIISADSRQVYKYLDIGTAKPTPGELRMVRHHFVDEILPDEDFNAGTFGERGRERIAGIVRRSKLPIVVGGSGLYVRSLVDGLFNGPGADDEFRNRMEEYVRGSGVRLLLDELKRVDPATAATIDPTKPRRIIRALEVHHLTGQPLSSLQRESQVQTEFESISFGLAWPREELYRRIEQRCEHMLAAGFLGEVERLERAGYDDSLNALKTVGYAEAFSYRRGEISYQEFVRLFKQNSRRYAKRQLTWFRADKRIEWIHLDGERSIPDVVGEVEEKFLRKSSVR